MICFHIYFFQMLAIFATRSFLIENENNIQIKICFAQYMPKTYVLIIIITKLKLLLLNCMRLETDLKRQLNNHYCIGQTR